MDTPEHIAKYRILRLLGQGAMGRVFLAEDPMIDRKVAIKVMSAEGDEEARERFRQEARTVGQLSHPNIVHLYDFGFHQGAPFLVMEYLEGESLDVWLRRGPSLGARLSVLLDLCRATAHAHSRGVLHRDVKPSNLQVLPDGSSKLLDFGIARGRSVGLTATGTVLGTPQFMAPEVLTDAGYSARSDLYAVALTVYEALAGSNPFRAATLEGCLTRVLTQRPPELATLVPWVPANFSEVVGAYLEKAPDQRPADLLELEAALQRLRDSVASDSVASDEAVGQMSATLPLLAAPATGPAPAPGTSGHRRLAAAALAAAFAALLLVAVLGPWRSEPAAPSPARPSSQPPAVARPQEVSVEPPSAPEETPPPSHPGPARPQEPPAEEPSPPAKETEKPQAEEAQPRETQARETVSSQVPAGESLPPAATAEPEEERAGEAGSPVREEGDLRPALPAAEAVEEDSGASPPAESAPAPATPVAPEARPALPAAAEAREERVPSKPAPRIDGVVPRTVRRGSTATLTITGSGLGPGAEVVIRQGTRPVEGMHLRRQKSEGETRIRVTLFVNQQVSIGLYTVVVVGTDGKESHPVNLEVSL